MNFITEYGLFLCKTLTLVFALLFLFAGIAFIKRRPKPTLEISPLNKEYNDLQHKMLLTIKGKKAAKALKEKKKTEDRPSLYVIDFHGDLKASAVDDLREEITAILAAAGTRDEIMIRLESPGGIVNSYGLAASQLQRIRDHNIPLTVCIDKMAASGGYLMSCVANTILAAPFAIIGSIGVVAQIPNFHRWLKKNDIDVELITAGEYKRTLTLLGENTEKGRKKVQEDIEKIHEAFSHYVFAHRPQVDIKRVATGEHWLAMEALGLQLIDKIQTSDDYLTSKMKERNIYKITHHGKQSLAEKVFKSCSSQLGKLNHWFA